MLMYAMLARVVGIFRIFLLFSHSLMKFLEPASKLTSYFSYTSQSEEQNDDHQQKYAIPGFQDEIY